jgi:epoxyqueuosine reductase QueG
MIVGERMKLTIENIIRDYVREYPKKNGTKPLWKEPIIVYADASNPKFAQLKEVVCQTHALPKDFVPNAKTVVAYFLPFIDEVSLSNVGGYHASPLWAEAYVETNKMISSINDHVKIKLNEHGYDANYAPPTAILDPEVLLSEWSHRHVAVIAGLGTFGLNNILITDRGSCGRIGTLVTDVEVSATPSPEKENCYYKLNGTCEKCLKQCEVGCFDKGEFDRFKCFARCLENGEVYKELGTAWVCGKCIVGLPCSIK